MSEDCKVRTILTDDLLASLLADVGHYKQASEVNGGIFENILENPPEKDAVLVQHDLGLPHLLLEAAVLLTQLHSPGEDDAPGWSDNDQPGGKIITNGKMNNFIIIKTY